MISSLASGALPWLIPPVCGALVGGALGFFVLGLFAPSLMVRNRSAIARAATNGVDALTQWALTLRVGELAPGRGSPAAASLERAIAESLRGVLGSRAVIYAVRDLVSAAVTALAARKVSDASREIGLRAFLAEKLLPALSLESNRQALARAAATLVAEQAGTALGDDVLREISGVFESYVPEAADALARWLRSVETRAYLSERGRELLPRILEKLSDLQKLFISAGQFDRRLNEKMPGIIDDTIDAAEKMVRDARQQERIVGLFFESARGWRDSLLVTPAGTSRPQSDPRQKLADSAATLLNRFMERLEDPQARLSVAGFVEERLFEDRRTLGAYLSDVFRISDSEIVEVLAARALDYLVRPDTAQAIARHLCGLLFSFVEENAHATIGTALRIDPARKHALDESLRARAPRIVEDVVPAISKIVSRSLRPGLLSSVIGAGMGFAIGLVLTLLRFLGYR